MILKVVWFIVCLLIILYFKDDIWFLSYIYIVIKWNFIMIFKYFIKFVLYLLSWIVMEKFRSDDS